MDKISADVIGNEQVGSLGCDERRESESRQVIRVNDDANNCRFDLAQIGRLRVKRSSFCSPEVER